jgi:hypothetical protein
MPEDKQQLIAEAQRLVDALLTVRDRLTDGEREFVSLMKSRLEQYQERAFISERQLHWLRVMEKKYAPDPRQMSLL